MFELIQDAPLVTLGVLTIGLALGLVAGIFVLPAARRARRLQAEIETMRGEHDRYQRRVTEHFQTTAVLVGDLTSSYKAVYEHLASGARTLSDPALSSHGFGAPRLIVDGAELDRLPQDPIAHDTDPVAEPAPVVSPLPEVPAGEASESSAEEPPAAGTETSSSPAAGATTTTVPGDRSAPRDRSTPGVALE